MHYDAIILGGGAAGLFCAAIAAQRGKKVAVLEHAGEVGKKILISGGGRCNFTNLECGPDNFLSANPHFPKSALARFRPADFVDLVRKHGIPFHEKKQGQLFCDGTARDIVRMLLEECRGTTIVTGCAITGVRRASGYVVESSRGEFHAPALVIATGGLSIPKIGATSFGYDLARRFGLKLAACRPALVPLVLSPEDRARYCDLAGVSAEVIASTGKRQFREKMLITHRGLSGPAILQISSYWQPGEEIALEPVGRPPKRLSQRLGDAAEWRIQPAGTEGYAKAEVTAGGVATDELSSKTMESNKVAGLYFIGEVVDVTGHLGGHNFQWAWASAHAAGQAI
jgi:hypothetical protein